MLIFDTGSELVLDADVVSDSITINHCQIEAETELTIVPWCQHDQIEEFRNLKFFILSYPN